MRRTADNYGKQGQKGCLCVVHHRAHGGKYTHTLLAPTHRHIPPLHRHTMHTHTRTREGHRNGVTVVKSGNIKVNSRSGVAVSQERTRTHIRTRSRILSTFPCFCVCFFRAASLCCFYAVSSDVVLPCLLTLWACRVGFASASCFVFLFS